MNISPILNISHQSMTSIVSQAYTGASTDAWFKNYPFCEHFAYSDDPYAPNIHEYANSFSAIFMCIFGCLGLFRSQYRSVIVRVTSALIAINGVASFLYHWTLYNFYGQFDTVSMIIPVYMGCIGAYDTILRHWLKRRYHSERLYDIVTSIVILIFCALLTLSLSAMSVTGLDIDFSSYFVFAQLFVIGVLPLYIFAFPSDGDENIIMARKYLVLGFIVGITSGILWFSTELPCRDNHKLAWTFSHAIWHFGISYSMFFLIVAITFYNNYTLGLRPSFHRPESKGTCCSCLQRAYYFLIPSIVNGVRSRQEGDITQVHYPELSSPRRLPPV